MDEQISQSKKRPASPPVVATQSATKKLKTRYNRATVDLNKRLSNAFAEHLTSNLNEEHRAKCLRTLNADSGSQAGEKVEELLAKFKGSNRISKQKTTKGSSEKINGNSQ